MINLTKQQTKEAVTDVLGHLGKIVVTAQGSHETPQPVIGIVTISIHADGNYDIGYAGQLLKGLVLGAIEDTKLHFYSTVTAVNAENQLLAMAQSAQIPNKNKN